jgi:hypothetical protein
MVAHGKFLSASENVDKSSADSNFSIANLFVYETPGGHVVYAFSLRKRNQIKKKKNATRK